VENLNERNPEDFSESPNIVTGELENAVHLSLNSIFAAGGYRQPKLRWLTYAELKAALDRVRRQPAQPGGAKDVRIDEMKIAMTIQEKFTSAFAVISFTLVGLPLGIAVSRRETSANLGLAVLLALGYYFLTIMIGWLDQHPEYRPDILLWLPNAIFIGLGYWLFRRMRAL
jgi:lipopolysaccharide export system permease protein